ncbi:Glycosyltransferase involved in cell wall biogenesis [Hahella chejuensis KCTC 2396]|uniref:Glycosyltransferase involved in cell wall biogenesis n=1 Tax=Hahella chejuensis (strain KCTC 2396) TaxID=349521 RepID=Q2SBM6_HAHCH|nr:glycosyltransferase family 2 protein [Hahella chejuensis]ABC31948.1 Glycosyltransferase involved in cell wall biogenesis [Hahella chejuensis KCTC 2396]
MISVVIPAKNELVNLKVLLPKLLASHPDAEIIVVDDGSSDGTGSYCIGLGIKVIAHKYSKGNGAAIKAGARAAAGDTLVFMDADGQHSPADIQILLNKLDEGYDMVVAARSRASQASLGRYLANSLYNKLASLMVDQRVEDLTSGFRVVRAGKFKQFLHLLPNGFSYPSTITMAFFRMGYSVGYQKVNVGQREGKSHIRPLHDGFRFLLIIFKIGTLYSPLKFFVPISLFFLFTGLGYYSYTYYNFHQFTNMSALLLVTSVIVFLIGLVSEQISGLQYSVGESEKSNNSE